MNVLGLTITIILIFVILKMPRRWAVLGVVSGVIYLTQGQEVNLGGINFMAIRFIEIVGFYRVIARKEFSISKLNSVDKYFLLFSSVYLFIFLVRSMVEPSFTESRMYQIGLFVDGTLSYFTFRGLLKDPEEFNQFLRDMVFLMMPFSMFLIVEAVTGKNFFSVMGGVPETPILRDGYYRCQGSFRHAITAGSLGATMMPLFIYLRASFEGRLRGTVGILICMVIIIASHSSGPLMGFAAGITAWMCWRWRKKMRTVRWFIAGSLVSLHLIMKAPVWFIIARVSDVLGGDGWHRANLIDKFVNNFKDWWLMGMPLEKTANWAATKMPWDAVDVTNEYILIGLTGGLISLVLFIILLKKYYQILGNSMKKIRNVQNSKQDELLLWGLGSSLVGHIVNLIAVTYFDQFYVMWYMTLAIVSSITICYCNDTVIINPGNLIAINTDSTNNYGMPRHI